MLPIRLQVGVLLCFKFMELTELQERYEEIKKKVEQLGRFL